MFQDDWYFAEQFLAQKKKELERQALANQIFIRETDSRKLAQRVQRRLGYWLLRVGYELLKPREREQIG
jgi:hypothetical protein